MIFELKERKNQKSFMKKYLSWINTLWDKIQIYVNIKKVNYILFDILFLLKKVLSGKSTKFK